MQKCCIKGCDSFKHKETENFGYFNFPIHDKLLLEKWLKQIQLPKWKATHQICSMHFAAEDIERRPNAKRLFLKPTSVPTILPVQTAIPINSSPTCCNSVFANTMTQLPSQSINVGQNGNGNMSVIQDQLMSSIPVQELVEISTQLPTNHSGLTNIQNGSQKFDSCLTRLNPSCEQSESLDQQFSIVQTKFQKILPKPESLPKLVPKANIRIISRSDHTDNSNNTATSLPSCYLGQKKAILRVTIYKLHNGLPGASCSKQSVDSVANGTTCIKEKENAVSDDKNPPCKEITIENSSTNRTVTFRLDPSTGEIILVPRNSDGSLVDKKKCERSTSINQKPPSSGARKITRVARRKRARVQDIKKKTEIIATTPPIKKLRGNSRLTRSRCKTRYA